MENKSTVDLKTPVKPSRLKRRLRSKEDRLNLWLRLILIILALVVFLAAAIFFYKYAQLRNQPPRTYYDLQLRIWQSAVQKHPTSAENHTNLGYIYYKMGNYRRALGEFNTALRYNSKAANAYYYRGLLYEKRGQYSKAIADFKLTAKYIGEGNKFLSLYELGKIYQDKKKYKTAAKYYNQAVKDKPMMWNTFARLGEVYEKLGEDSKALENYKKAARFNPNNSKLKKAISRLSK